MLYILVHIKSKSVNQLANELNLHRNTIGRYRKIIFEFLVENQVDPTFKGD
jgi:hypothetical protein